VKSNWVKLVSAVIGASALVVMGVLTVALGGEPTGSQNLVQPAMTTGETSTESTAPMELETSVAEPPFTFTTPEGFAVPH
jgi:hypothetical protein